MSLIVASALAEVDPEASTSRLQNASDTVMGSHETSFNSMSLFLSYLL